MPEPTPTLSTEEFEERARFIVELARRLHLAGVSASRLEGAIQATARALKVNCEIWSAPTGLLLSLGDAGELRGAQLTRVLRLEPSEVDLSALVALDEIADEVIAGRLSIASAWNSMRALDRPPERRDNLQAIGAFGLAAAAVAALLRTGWTDIAVAGILGLLIGWLALEGGKRPHVAPAVEAIAALVATFLATAFSSYIAPISLQTVVIAALIVLMPGLALTTAVAELAAQQLVTGTTRFAGAVMTLLKLTFGSIAATQLTGVLGWVPRSPPPSELPAVVEVMALGAAAFALAVLFRAPKRDLWLVMGSAVAGYIFTRAGNIWLGLGEGTTFAGAVFFASMLVGALANLYGRVARRPAALVRVPGIMLLVPGSVGFRGLTSVMERDYALGLETGVAVLGALIGLVAGLLFGSLLIPPRRHL